MKSTIIKKNCTASYDYIDFPMYINIHTHTTIHKRFARTTKYNQGQ